MEHVTDKEAVGCLAHGELVAGSEHVGSIPTLLTNLCSISLKRATLSPSNG